MIFNCLLTAAAEGRGAGGPFGAGGGAAVDNSLNVVFDIEPKLALIKRDNKANSYTKRGSSWLSEQAVIGRKLHSHFN